MHEISINNLDSIFCSFGMVFPYFDHCFRSDVYHIVWIVLLLLVCSLLEFVLLVLSCNFEAQKLVRR